MHHLHHPPVYFLLTTAAGISLRPLLAVWDLHQRFPDWSRYPAIALFCLGGSFGAVSVYFFLRSHTGIIPFSPTTHIVKKGFYKFTRNPMYLGLICIQVSLFIIFGNYFSLLSTLLFWWILHSQFVIREEQLLLEQFGKEYEQLLHQSRRWL